MTQKQGYQTTASSGRTRSARPTERYRKKGNTKHIRIIILAVLLAVIVGCAVFYISRVTEAKRYDGIFLDNIYVDDIPLAGMTPDEAKQKLLSTIASRQNSWSLALMHEGHTFYTLDYATMGIRIDEAQALHLLRQAYDIGHTGGTFQRWQDIQQQKNQVWSRSTTASSMNTDNLDLILTQIAENMYREPQDAYLLYFDPDSPHPFTIAPEQNGYMLDIAKYRQVILDSIASGTSGSLELTPDLLTPQVTTAQVQENLQLLGTGITPISPSSTDNRNNNIRVAFSRYNGLIVQSGDKVSFNDVVGERTVANGFYEAYEYVNGNLSTGIGGGVCQASSTIYKAALLSNLRINKREPHSEEVSYTIFGQDATVYWGGRKIDFVFTNSTGMPLYITAHVEQVGKNELQCIVKFYGRSLGDGVYYTLDTRTIEIIPMPEVPEIRKDKDAEYVTYQDEEYLYFEGRDGYVNETWLQKWENSVMVSETLVSTDTLEAKGPIIYVGIADPITILPQ